MAQPWLWLCSSRRGDAPSVVSQSGFVTWLGAQTRGKSKPAPLLLASDAQPLKPLQTAPQQKLRSPASSPRLQTLFEEHAHCYSFSGKILSSL